MKEIEVKAHLKDKERVINELKKIGAALSAPIKQIDTVYTRVIGKKELYLSNDHFVRIREKSDGRFIFTVKADKSKKEALIKTEHETEVKDAKELEQALFLMDYQISNKVTKVRQTATVGYYEICLDDVEELGSFIEVEKMAGTDADVNAIVVELNSFIASLGVPEIDVINKGYDIMMIEKMFGK